ncbi:hypothetical protein [Paracoccus litorisediminis]|uniref:Uncharacterized protein n=1 Tax=Paracoccus litorisediminis TaxID=2006130 RepID=A0A844HLL1_9RHOB|nr:hypothetical protein [Paracoccus litorisediminis]MTH61163.1 hypothetical protein [Paracoccus litorisediminis]
MEKIIAATARHQAAAEDREDRERRRIEERLAKKREREERKKQGIRAQSEARENSQKRREDAHRRITEEIASVVDDVGIRAGLQTVADEAAKRGFTTVRGQAWTRQNLHPVYQAAVRLLSDQKRLVALVRKDPQGLYIKNFGAGKDYRPGADGDGGLEQGDSVRVSYTPGEALLIVLPDGREIHWPVEDR